MANSANKSPKNVPGRFYVDDQCIDCDLCRELAPDCFARDHDAGTSFLSRQPATPEEEELCREALESCPVSAIGDDGE
ncbi:MAG: ferredoxin [Puniceicoccales bacterium]|jgi:ferredoxin|nr:ferredoxin [Puniceicoccales bacterium]